MSSKYHGLLGAEMDDSAIDELLVENGVGVLSMTAEGVPYGVPLSFGYDGDDTLYFLFVGPSTELRKEFYAEQTGVASFATLDVAPDGGWRSVIVSGTLERVTHETWDAAREAMADNAYRSELMTAHDIDENPNVWALGIEERSGRAVGQQ